MSKCIKTGDQFHYLGDDNKPECGAELTEPVEICDEAEISMRGQWCNSCLTAVYVLNPYGLKGNSYGNK